MSTTLYTVGNRQETLPAKSDANARILAGDLQQLEASTERTAALVMRLERELGRNSKHHDNLVNAACHLLEAAKALGTCAGQARLDAR